MSNPNPTAEDTADEQPDEQVVDEHPDDSADATPASVDHTTDTGSRLVTFVEYAAFGILCLLALVATFRFYFAASEAIRIWFNRDWVPVFQAAFNLVVLVAAAIGISVLVRRIT